MKKAAFALLLFACLPAQADDAATAAANAFYSVTVGAHSVSGIGIPDAAARMRLQPLLSPGLNQALADAAAAEARFKARNKSSPPLIEGDIFSSLFEGPTSWKIGACLGDDKTARCAVVMTRQDRGKPAVNW